MAERLGLLVLHVKRHADHALGLDNAVGVVSESPRKLLVYARHAHPVLDFAVNFSGLEQNVGDFVGFRIELRHFFEGRRRSGEFAGVFEGKSGVINGHRPELRLRIIGHDPQIRLPGIVPLQEFLIAFGRPELGLG